MWFFALILFQNYPQFFLENEQYENIAYRVWTMEKEEPTNCCPATFSPLSQFTECSGRHLKGSWVHWTTTNHQVAFFAHDKLWTPHYINPPIYISKWVFWQTSAPQLPKLSGNWGTNTGKRRKKRLIVMEMFWKHWRMSVRWWLGLII